MKFTKDEVALLQSVLPKRITRLQGFSTPDQFVRDAWPIATSREELEEYKVRYAKIQKNIKLYQSILKKLEA